MPRYSIASRFKRFYKPHTKTLTKPRTIRTLRALSELSLIDAQVVKLVDTLASGASARKGVEVQVLSWAPF